MSLDIHNLIQTSAPKTDDGSKLLFILDTINSEVDSLLARLEQAETALSKAGLYRCGFTQEWFRMPEEGAMLVALGKPASWKGMTQLAKQGKLGPSLANSLCDLLMTQQRPAIDSALRDKVSRISGPAELASALGLKYPFRESTGFFATWLKATGNLR